MTNRSISVLSLVVLYTSFVNGKTTCKQLLVQEWHPQPSLYVVNWTLTENICVDFYRECWALDTNIKMNTLDFQVIPQICPLQIQFGDILVISTESSLQSLELNLMNASEALFIDCLQNTMIEDQLLFDYKLKGMQTVNSQWLDVGTHYFISVVTSGPSPCQLGLRLNVTVKQQFCQETLGVEFCSGHGKCLSNIWNKSYSCQCQTPYSGKYCEELDVSYYKPCKNNGSCISRRGEWNKHGYECICNPPFTGRNCSEIIGRCQAHTCFHGNCSNITANSFICECDEEFSGPFCEDSIKPYDSWSCWKEGIYQNSTSSCIFEYPEEFLNQNCEFDTSECSSIATWNGTNCINSSNDVMCICSPMLTGKFCKIIEMPHESFPEKNNITCSTHEEDWHCSCIPGVTGKIGEKVIDHCRLLSINCLDERWRFSIIGGFEYTCILWYTRNSSSCVKNIHLIHHSCCYCGVTCNDICGAKVLPQFDYVCQLESAGYEGEKFQVAIVAYFSLADNCVGNGTDMNTLEDISHVCCFPYEGITQSCTDGCTILAEEESQSYWCICGLGWAVTLHLENTTDYPANICQHEDQRKGEINITSCICTAGYVGRFRVVNDEYWVGNQSSPEHRLFPAHLHNCNCSCLQRYGRNNSGTEYYKSVPCKTGATSIHLSGYFFCKCVSGFAGLLCEINRKKCDFSPWLHNSTSAELKERFKCICHPGFIGTSSEIDTDKCASRPCKNGATCIDQQSNYFCQCMPPFKGSHCEFGPCEPKNPCENGAICREKMDLEAFPLGFQCQCGEGFAGPRCEVNVDECSSNPCLNGYCYDMIAGFSCLCSPGHAGLRCEHHIDDCLLHACEHNATCEDLHLSYRCVCQSGWEGHFCEQESNECKMNPCENNSTCTDLYKSYRCDCKSGWTGKNCSEEINECDSDPCMNGALCHESIVPGQFICLCPPFYMGQFCHQRYNTCDLINDTCRNNSTCLTLVDGNHCICREGFLGDHCEIDVNECLSLPCQNYGDCEDGVNEFRCVCRPGFSGHLCEIEINECSSKPCKNNGTCVDLENSFLCNCQPGYHGSFCELTGNECKTSSCAEAENCVSTSGEDSCICGPGYTGSDCEVNIDECLSEPCLHDGDCIDGVNHYTCDCKSGFFGTHCETNANDCFSNPCQHGRCIDLINAYQCLCDAEWTSTRCEVKITDCSSITCMNEGFCQESIHGFTCICPLGYTGAYCEKSFEPEMNLVLCLNGGIRVDGPEHNFDCRCLSGFSGQFCEINIDECSSSPCLHGANCEDHINGYICICQQGWSGHHCEKEVYECIDNSCTAIYKDEPGSSYFYTSESVTCSIGLLHDDEMSRVTCLLPISQRTDVTSSQTYIILPSETSVSSSPSVRATAIWTTMDTYPADQAVSSSGFLNFGVHEEAQTVWSKTSVSQLSIQTSVAMPTFFFPDRRKTPLMGSSLLTDFTFPTQSFLLERYQTAALFATTMNSVISDIAGAATELNRHSLLSRGFTLSTASTSAPPVVSRGAEEGIEKYSAVSLISRIQHWRLLSSSMSPILPAKIIISKQVAILNSSTLHRFSTQASLSSEHHAITEASSDRRLTNINSQAADSLSELSQTCATCSMTEIKSSYEFSDQVLHRKQSHFYETFWMNSAILASWYALMGTQTITSGHAFSSPTEITPSVAFTELSSLFPSKKSAKGTILSSSLEESITLSSNLDVNLCLYKTCLSIVPSQTVSSDFMNSDLTSQLTTDDLSLSENILKLLKIGQYPVAVAPTGILSQGNVKDIEEGGVPHTHIKHHRSDNSLDLELSLQTDSSVTLKINTETVRSNDFKNRLPLPTDSLSDFAQIFSNVALYTISAPQPLPVQTSFPTSVSQPSSPFYMDYPPFTSDLKEQGRTAVDWPRWELQPSMQDRQSLAASQGPSITRPLTLSSLESLTAPQQLIVSDFSCIQYYGDSYLKFQNVFLNQQNSISLEFQTSSSYGLLLYVKQDSDSVDKFFTQLFVENGTLKYQFFCAGDAELKSINTTIRVDNGQKYTLLIRQELDPCKAELTILERIIKFSETTHPLSGKPLPISGSVFIGGSPHLHGKDQISGPVSMENFTGCIEVIEFNNLRSFIPSKAVEKYHIDNCRSQDLALSPATTFIAPSGTTQGNDSRPTSLGPSPAAPSVCQETTCHHGGTCRPIFLSSGSYAFQCDCPLRFTGRFCEKDAGLLFPSFNGNSYLELPFFTNLDDMKFILEKKHNRIVTIYLTIKTSSLNGTILYSTDSNFGEQFLHLFLVEGRPTVKYGCGSSQNILTVSANYTINRNAFIPITIRYTVPIGSPEVTCMIEMAAGGEPPMQKKNIETTYTQGYFESMFLGSIPGNVKISKSVGQIFGFEGCIRELQVNNKEVLIIQEALHGKNIENCYIPWCDHHLCHNNGTCISDGENWFCECPRLYSGQLCQFSICENNPCGNGATCVPKSGTDIVCLCPYGRSGPLCTDAINITQPRFSGTDASGYTSFLAYSRISDISFNYEFHLKFQLANNHSSLQNNLIFFTGQKGHGLNGDDFLSVGLLDGCVVYSYNLGSGIASIRSEPLDLSLKIHTVYLGRFFRKGWLKVDDHQNKSIISPGRLIGLNVFSQFYVGGYSEYLPDLLPDGASFKNGFQGCIFTLQVRTEKDSHFRGLGNPEGRPIAGRTVGQCDASPCSLMKCGNGGTCIEDGAVVYCKCPTGWKGTFCTQAVSTCDPEHDPPHHCSKGATCVSLPHGYTCYCPLGTTGIYCEQAFSISDPSFRSDELSWMSFAPFQIRKKTHIQLQFQPLAMEGILFYVAQHLKAQSGDFLCLSLVKGSVQLRYNLGDRTIILENPQKITANGSIWHMIKAGRVGAEGYLEVDGMNITEKASAKMSSLDTNTDFYVGGLSSLNLVNPMATANEPAGFQGCVREVIINNQELQLTELGAKDGSNVGDCDGTACGYSTCRNGGECMVNGTAFSCRCSPHWTGNTCNESVHCLNNPCLHQSLCIPDRSFSYSCLCTLGWVGRHCENKTSFSTAKFMGNSYIKYSDPNYKDRNLQFTTISLNFSTTETEGLIVWMGKAQNEENDFLAIGLHNQILRIAVNLGGKISVSMSYSNVTFCCNKWHHVAVNQNQTLITAYLDNSLILSKDIDSHKTFVALNYGGICYLGGFEYGRKVNIITQEIFKRDFVGKIKDVVLFQDSKKIELIKSEGHNVYDGDESN